MSPIKSALELALEKTKDLKVDPVKREADELKLEGKRLAGDFLNSPEKTDIAKAMNAYRKDKQSIVKEGAFDVLCTRIQLPLSKNADLAALYGIISRGFAALSAVPVHEKKITELFAQLGDFMNRYLDDVSKLEGAAKKQYEPRLRKKEQEIAARTGQAVHLDPMSDPEFVSFFQQNLARLKSQYQAALDDVKLQLAEILEIHRDDSTE